MTFNRKLFDALHAESKSGKLSLVNLSPRTKHDAIVLLISAIEDIQHNWDNGDLAEAVYSAITIKDEICQRFNIPATAAVAADNK